MIGLLLAASLGGFQPLATQPPNPGSYTCPSADPRCSRRPRNNAPVCEPPYHMNANGVCTPRPLPPPPCPPRTRAANGACLVVENRPSLVECPGGVRIAEGYPCPLATLPPAIVYFDWGSSNLTPQARSVLDGFLANYRLSGRARLTVAGHTDRSGSAAYNVGLSQRQANAVRDYLVRGGVAPAAISVTALGESRPLVPTPDGVREPHNRRVEVRFEAADR